MTPALILAASFFAAQPAAQAPAQPPAQAPAQAATQAPAQPQGWSVAEFIAKAQALMLAGQVAADSPDLQALREQIISAGRAVRAQQTADSEAGRPAVYCMPQEARAEGTELITFLLTIPEAQRGISFREGFGRYVRNKYPCPTR